MRCQLMDALTWAYPDSEIGRVPCRRLALDVARGGTGAVTLLLNDAVPKMPVRLTVLSKSGHRPRFFKLVDVPVEGNTGPLGFAEVSKEKNPYVTRRAPFRVYDAMRPIGASFQANAATQAVRIELPIPFDAKPGLESYCIGVRQGQDTQELKLDLHVFRACIPPVGRASWQYTNWFSLDNMAARHRLAPWSAAHWAMIGRYARLMAHNRQNTFIVRFADIFTAGQSGLTLNRQRLRRLVKTFTAAGLYYIEGGHFGRRSSSAWASCATFNVALTEIKATAEEGNRIIAGAARQLMEEIETQGWRSRYIQHVTDEPSKENAADYRMFVGIVRKYMPGIPILDAVMDPTMAGAVDIWCPQAQEYQKERARFDAMRAQGDRLWFYTCCYPGGPWLNRLLDMELLRPTLLGWGAARFGLDGFLHWGLNQYRKDQDPFIMSVVPNWGGGPSSLPPGDTHVVYPGAGGPWSSVRFEAQREGIEDLELWRCLARKNPKQAAALLRPVIRGFDDYTKDVSVLRRARRTLLRLLD